MYKRVCAPFIIILIFFFPTILWASSPESQALVTQGREVLFNNGNPTYQGIVSADDKFAAAVQADSSNQQANFFYALTRIAVFALKNGDGTSLQTIADIITAMGIPIHLDRFIKIDDSPLGEPPEIADKYNPPTSMPNGYEVSEVLGQGLVAVIDQAMANLDATDATISVLLTAQELDDFSDMEIDYADVLLAKGALSMLKTMLLVITAYDMDTVDIREIIALDNAGMLNFPVGAVNSILERYPNFLQLADSVKLTNAKSTFLAAYDYFFNAKLSLKQEIDNQENDLFVFESPGDEQEFDSHLNMFSELIDSLNDNRSATKKYKERNWRVQTNNGDNIDLHIEEFELGNAGLMKEDSYFWGTIGGSYVYDQITFHEVDGNTVSIILDYWGYKRIVADGILDTATGTISGTCTYQTYNGSTYVQEYVSSFSATLTNFREDEIEEFVNLNALFGNTGKSQLVIRDVLPQFDQFNEPIEGTFPEPAFNGLIPDIVTNTDIAQEMDFDQPYEIFTIPDASIALDGNSSDLAGTKYCS
jgi:hypothetical protein